MTDPRNLSDKQFLNDSIRTLLRYLTEHNFDHSISPKILSRPSNKDFSNIALFLFRQYDPNFTLTGKFEDEIVAMFKQIGYPCQISKANITAAGTPHAWPSLLAALVWLVEVLQYDEALGPAGFGTSQADPNADIDDRAASQAVFYTYLSQAYTLFMLGEDDRYTDLEKKFIENFEANNTIIQDEIVGLEQRNQMLANEIENVERRRSLLPELENRKKEYQQELSKYKTLIDQLEKQRMQLQTKAYARQMELDKLTNVLSITNEEISELRSKISQQELSPEDVRRMTSQREQIEEAHTITIENKHIQQDRIRELEQNLRDRVESLADTARNYNQTAEDLKLVPHTARNARGKNLTLEVDVRAKRREDLLRTDVRVTLLPPLQGLKREIQETSSSIRNELMTETDILEECISRESEFLEIKTTAENKLRKLEELYRREKDMMEQAEFRLQQEVAILESKLMKIRDNVVEETRLSVAMRGLEDARIAKEVLKSDHERKRNEIMESILDVVTQCANHREMAQTKLKKLKDKYSSRLDECLWGKGITGELQATMNSITADISNSTRDVYQETVTLSNFTTKTDSNTGSKIHIRNQSVTDSTVKPNFDISEIIVSTPTNKSGVPTITSTQSLKSGFSPSNVKASVNKKITTPKTEKMESNTRDAVKDNFLMSLLNLDNDSSPIKSQDLSSNQIFLQSGGENSVHSQQDDDNNNEYNQV
jgi:kinetochore protein NDC80